MTASALRPEEGRWARFARRHKLNVGLLFVLPAMLLYTLYVAWPVISTVQASFFDWDGISPDRVFIGLQNYVDLFTRDRAFRSSIVNNVLWSFIVVGSLLVVGFLHRLRAERTAPPAQPLSHRVLPARPRPRSSWSRSSGATSTARASGPLNALLRDLGLDDFTRVWLADAQVTIFAVMGVAIWASLGLFLVVFLAAINSIPQGAVRERRHRRRERVAASCATSRIR